MLGRLVRVQRETHKAFARSYATITEKNAYKKFSATLNLPTTDFQPWVKNPVQEEKKMREICCDYVNTWNDQKVGKL
jgi:Trm5-related predicted tRNA methylase